MTGQRFGVALEIRAHRLNVFGWVFVEHRVGFRIHDADDDVVFRPDEDPGADLAAFSSSAEVSELVVVEAPRDDVVFPLDAEVIAGLRPSFRRACGAAGPAGGPALWG